MTLPEEIWIAGKGPSLDSYDWSKAGWCRIGINEAALVVPECYGAIALDYAVQRRYLKELDSRILVFRKSTHTNYNYPNMYIWKLGREVGHVFATAPTATQIFAYLGAKVIHYVGFDSITTRRNDCSNKVDSIKGRGENSDGYVAINKELKRIIRDYGITAIWEHELQDC